MRYGWHDLERSCGEWFDTAHNEGHRHITVDFSIGRTHNRAHIECWCSNTDGFDVDGLSA